MLRYAIGSFWMLVAAQLVFSQPPAIDPLGVVNAASRMPPSLGGGAIARGSRFLVHGIRLGTSTASTKVQLSGGAWRASAAVLSVGPRTIEAMMPEDAPLGEVEILVVRDSSASKAQGLRVVASSFGIFRMDDWPLSRGRLANLLGSGREQNAPEHAARPGQRVSLKGTGLGSARQPVVNIAGVNVTPLVQRSKGIDELVFTLPATVRQGCFVPVYVQSGGVVSNVVTMSIEAAGKACIASPLWPVTDAAKRVGFVSLTRSTVAMSTGAQREAVVSTWDSALAVFLDRGEAYFAPWDGLPPLGSCTMFTGNFQPDFLLAGGAPALALSVLHGRTLSAGRSVTVTAGGKTRAISAAQHEPGYYAAPLGGQTPSPMAVKTPLFLESGEAGVSAGGGSDVGAFEVALAVPRGFTSTNLNRLGTIDRGRPLVVEWRTADPAQYVAIFAGNVDQETNAAGLCFCLVRAGQGRFTIPVQMLANLPASQDIPGIPLSVLAVIALPDRTSNVTAKGIDAGIGLASVLEGRSVVFR